ncbi:MAG: hypothetical protein PHN37_01040 [Candidatus Pacebacteria bacterium]|nr:hypothetical protein [Candidatus Paceibacterota bacterium]
MASSNKKVSVFEKNTHISHTKARELLRRGKSRLYERYGISSNEIEKLAREITDYKYFGSLISSNDIKNFEKIKKKEIARMKDLNEKHKTRVELEKEIRALRDIFLGEK